MLQKLHLLAVQLLIRISFFCAQWPLKTELRQAYLDVTFVTFSIKVLIYFALSLIVHKHCCSILILCVQFLLTLFSKSYKTCFHLHVDYFDFHGIVSQGAHLNLVLYYLVCE
jgi:hypothetical protein